MVCSRTLLGEAPLLLPAQVELREVVGSGRFGPILASLDMESQARLLTHRTKSNPQTQESVWVLNENPLTAPFQLGCEDLRDFLVLLDGSVRAGQHPNILGLVGLADLDGPPTPVLLSSPNEAFFARRALGVHRGGQRALPPGPPQGVPDNRPLPRLRFPARHRQPHGGPQALCYPHWPREGSRPPPLQRGKGRY